VTVDLLLVDAADAIDTQRWPDAAAKLLEAWDACRSERIARALAAVDLRLPPPAPLEGKLVRTREEHWHALVAFGDEESVRRALAAPWPTHPKEARARLAALAPKLSARVSNALLAVHRGSLYTSRTGMRLSRGIFQLLLAADDHAAVGELERLEQRPLEAYRLGPAILRRVRPAAPSFTPAADAALARMDRALVVEERVGASTRDNLLAAIYATPNDDAPRLVYADVLAEAGDPRGEFITLQLQGGDEKRVQKLLRAAGRAWFDGLDADGAKQIVHRRGFPAEATLSAGEVRAPAWATIEKLHVGGDGTFAGGPHLRGLRELYDVAAVSLATAQLAAHDLDVLVVHSLLPELPATELAPRTLGLSRAHVRGAAAVVRALPTSPLARRLETVRFGADFRQLGPALELAREVPFAIELMGGWYLDRFTQWSVRITGRAVTVAWHGAGPHEVGFDGLLSLFQALPPMPVETLEITGTEVGMDRLRESLVAIVAKWPALKTAQIFGIRAR
jgi:uncharacterized protein (TIGR02996 family)